MADEFLKGDAVLRRFLGSLKDYAIVLLDPEGLVVDWNAGARALKGYSAEEVMGTHFSRFFPPEAVAIGHPERVLAAAAIQGRYEEEGWRVRKDGTRFWASVIITAIHDDDRVLRGFGKVLRDFTERKHVAERSADMMKLLETTASTDYLTALNNRRAFDKALTAAFSFARRQSQALSLAMIDIDRFKAFNDQFGHLYGDGYLRRAAALWSECLRSEDFIARYGGEEFVVLLPGTGLAGAMTCMERVRVASAPPLTCSIGVAQWDGKETPDRLIGRADHALYQAKANGRDQVVAASMARSQTRDHVASKAAVRRPARATSAAEMARSLQAPAGSSNPVARA